MLLSILTKAGKFAPHIAMMAIGGFIALMVESKFFKPEAIDYSKIEKVDYSKIESIVKSIPPPQVSVQPFDVEKIKGLREFNYSPQFTGSVSVAGVDSVSLRKMIDASIDRALKKYVKPKFLK